VGGCLRKETRKTHKQRGREIETEERARARARAREGGREVAVLCWRLQLLVSAVVCVRVRQRGGGERESV